MQLKPGWSAHLLIGLHIVGVGNIIPAAAGEGWRDTRTAVERGVFGNVRESRVTGDLGGIEIEFNGGTVQQITTTLCEGWCNLVYRTRYENRDGVIYYQLPEELTDQDGNTLLNPIPIALKPSGKMWLAKIGDEKTWYPLRRLKKPFGLAIAREKMRSSKGS